MFEIKKEKIFMTTAERHKLGQCLENEQNSFEKFCAVLLIKNQNEIEIQKRTFEESFWNISYSIGWDGSTGNGSS